VEQILAPTQSIKFLLLKNIKKKRKKFNTIWYVDVLHAYFPCDEKVYLI
jgi:hypothetical protein